MDRESAFDRLGDATLDVLVVGGGITGAGIALDAAARGYTVAVVERDDVASGTSSKSSKLIHGGVRYLEQYDFGLVREAVRERDLLRNLAPHLVRPLGFVLPVDHRGTQALMKAGMSLYDGMAAFRNVRRHRHLSPDEVLGVAPGLRQGFDHGAYRYYDCQTDDARLTLAVMQQARAAGALVVNHAEVTQLRRTGGRVVGAEVVDGLTGSAIEVGARWIVSATGVWADRVRGLADPDAARDIVPSRGVHLAFSREYLPIEQALLIPTHAGDGRMVFLIPWGDQVYAGTTDVEYAGDPDAPSLDADGAGYLLHAINTGFGLSLTERDAVGAWAGLRPLTRTHDGDTRDLSRRHAITESPAGLVTITGGKLTTYRQMAEDLVDHLAKADGNTTPCRTATTPLGATGRPEDGVARLRAVLPTLGLPVEFAGSLYHRHGDQAGEVAAFCLEHDEAELLVPELPYLRGEIRWAIRHELARTVDDLLQRRTRVSLRHQAAGGAAAAWTADVVAEELGLSPEERAEQLRVYVDNVERERALFPVAGRAGLLVS